MSNQIAQTLAKEIESAFATVPYPGDDNIILAEMAGSPDWDAVVTAFKGKDWRELPLEFLLHHYDGFYVFSPEAYRYYLPAVLVLALLEYERADLIPIFLIYGLDPSRDVYADLRFKDRIRGFTLSQRDAVKAFLEFMKNQYSEELDLGEDIDRALANLETQGK